MRRRLFSWLAAALAAATVGGLAGCGSTRLLSGGTRSTVTAHESAATATTTTATTTTAASVSTVVTTTINGTTTTVAQPGTGKPTILLGDLNTPEQFIIGELYQNALKAQGYQVDLSRNIGPIQVSEAAMGQGSLDIFPEYLNVYDTQVAGDPEHFKNVPGAYNAGQRWATAHDQELLRPTPFADTAGLAVLSSYARRHHLRTLGDLRRVQASLTVGSPSEFITQAGGLEELEYAYDFTPAVTSVISLGSQYDALQAGTLQAAYVETTDWQLTSPVFTVLADSKHVLGFGNIIPVISRAAVEREGPAFTRAIDQVDALLTMSAMRGLVSEMKASTDPAMSASDVAQEFLQGYNIGPPPPWSTVTATTTTPSGQT